MTDRIGVAVDAVTTVARHLAGLPAVTQIILTAALVMLLGYGEYRRRIRTTPSLATRAAGLLSATLKTLRAPSTTEQKDRRGDRIELLLVTFFVVVVAGLIMRGLVDFARDSMGLAGVWPYLLFAAFDGAAGLFAFASYRWALKHGASPLFPRLMVGLILGASAWFQWTHAVAAGNPLAGQVAWAALPAIGAVLWEFVLRQRMKAWKKAQPSNTESIPRPRWLLAPFQSAAMKRRMVLWGTGSYDQAVGLHVTRVQCMRLLRREFGLFWSRRVPADVAFQLRAGVRIREAAEKVPEVIEAHRREVENRRIVKQAKADARAGRIEPGTYTVSVAPAPIVDLSPVPGMADVVEPLPPEEEYEGAASPWTNKAPEVGTEVFTPASPVPDPWEHALPADAPFPPLQTPSAIPAPGSTVESEPPADDGFWSTLTGAGEDVTPAQRATTPPVEYRPAPYDGPEFDKAVTLYLDSVAAAKRGELGNPLSGRALCRAMDVSPNNRRWVRAVQSAASTQPGGTMP